MTRRLAVAVAAACAGVVLLTGCPGGVSPDCPWPTVARWDDQRGQWVCAAKGQTR